LVCTSVLCASASTLWKETRDTAENWC
jgi:hypothetical protein